MKKIFISIFILINYGNCENMKNKTIVIENSEENLIEMIKKRDSNMSYGSVQNKEITREEFLEETLISYIRMNKKLRTRYEDCKKENLLEQMKN